MALAHSKVTAQGQISVPAGIRKKLGIGPGSILEWDEEDGRIVVRRSTRFSSLDIHRALFPDQAPKPRTLDDLKEGIRRNIRKRHAAVDTNVLVRILTRDDARQTAAADVFVERGAWVSILALSEALWVLDSVYDRNSTSIAAAVRMLLNHEALVLQDSDAVAGALELFCARPSLGFSGCLMVQLARKAGHLPLGTFDRNLGKIEGTQKL